MTLRMPDLTSHTSMERMGVRFAYIVAALVGFVTIAPYFGYYPKGTESTLTLHLSIVQTILTVFIMVASFLFGTSVGSSKKDGALADQASTIQQAQSVLAPLVNGDTMKLDPGDTATALATDDGTVIKKTSDPSPGDIA